MYRQGDVLIEKVIEVPERAKTEERLLVRGEGRNHGHFVNGGEVDVLEACEGERSEGGGIITQYLDVKSEMELAHLLIDSRELTSEHAPILIPPGKYRVIKQREYDPYAKAIRAVKD